MSRHRQFRPGGRLGISAASIASIVLAIAILTYDNSLGLQSTVGPVAGGRTVIIRGANFTGATGVTFGGTAGTSFSVTNATTISVVAPAKAAGAYDVVIQHPLGNTTITNGYTYVALPVISSATLSQSTDYHNGGTTITVTGATGIRATQTLTLGGDAVYLTYISPTSFSFVTRSKLVSQVGAKDLVIADEFGATSTKSSALTVAVNPYPARFTSGLVMDGVAAAGGVYQLIGASTGAEIVTLQCVTVSPVTYRMKGNANWYQATGTEFDGVFKWVAVGAGGAITWAATPGSRTAGGMKYAGGGTIELQGLALMDNWTGTHTSLVYIIAHDTAPVNGRCLMSVWTTPGVNTNITGGGLAYATASLRNAAVSSKDRDAPSITVAGTAVTATASAEWIIRGDKYINATNMTGVGIAYTGTTGNVIGAASFAAVAAGTQSRLGICKVGDIDFNLLQTNASGVGVT